MCASRALELDLNPQAAQMADESMVRNLAAQARCIWPQEEPLVRRYGLGDGAARILDAGCGTGEITGRLARLFPTAEVLGVDVLDEHLARARAAHAALGARVRFENRSVFELGVPAATFELVVCRHVLQAVPHADRVLAELTRVLRPGGWLHVIAEDYGMIHFAASELDPDHLWDVAPARFAAATGTDLRIGRHAYRWLRGLGLESVTVDYVVVDPLRVAREDFAAIWEAWRDGYADAVAAHAGLDGDEVRAHFDSMLETLRDPSGYGVWFVPVVAGRKPAAPERAR